MIEGDRSKIMAIRTGTNGNDNLSSPVVVPFNSYEIDTFYPLLGIDIVRGVPTDHDVGITGEEPYEHIHGGGSLYVDYSSLSSNVTMNLSYDDFYYSEYMHWGSISTADGRNSIALRFIDSIDAKLGAGNDTVSIADILGGSLVVDAGAGYDTFKSLVEFRLSADFVASLGTNTILPWLKGFEAYELKVYSTLDRRVITDAGNDSIEATGSAKYFIDVKAGNDIVKGGDGDDVIIGGKGNDAIDGGGGTDEIRLIGNRSDYSFSFAAGVMTITDLRTGSISDGIDKVSNAELVTFADGAATVTQLLAGGSRVITGTAGQDKITPLGVVQIVNGVEVQIPGQPRPKAGNDVISTLAGNDYIDGGKGADQMSGGTCDDTYVVDDVNDQTFELVSQGIDTVLSTLSWTLAANTEQLTLLGKGKVNGTGNALSNKLTGNDASNILDGGLGDDAMAGGAGDDVYLVDSTRDTVTELAGGGIDTVEAVQSYTLGANTENLRLSGYSSSVGRGNVLNNTIWGGYSSNDTLYGMDGDDILHVNGNGETLVGGKGNDTYSSQSTGTVLINVVELANGGIDTFISINISHTLAENVENLVLLADAGTGTGNQLDNIITGSSRNYQTLYGLGGNDTLYGEGGIDTLDGGLGADKMYGGTGKDQYFVDNVRDKVIELSSVFDGDHVNSTISYKLTANVEKLSLAGSSAINGTGNELANSLTGNSANNIVNGMAGNDILIAGDGNDMLVGGDGIDTLTGGAGSDRFVFGKAIAANADILKDFTTVDFLMFKGVDYGITKATLKLVNGTAAIGTDSQFFYASGILSFDADGAGGAAATQIASGIRLASLALDDFLIV
jgi:Ca2+-binding RTX toxin-like protein